MHRLLPIFYQIPPMMLMNRAIVRPVIGYTDLKNKTNLYNPHSDQNMILAKTKKLFKIKKRINKHIFSQIKK